MKNVNNSLFNNSWYYPGKSFFYRLLWYYTSLFFFQGYLLPFNKIKILLLRIFGAQIGNNVLVKPSVLIKYPWNLVIVNNTWIGENVWIDNLVPIKIGNNVCISQGAYLFTGNHNYKAVSFDLIVNEIVIEDGVWIGAKAVVCPGVICHSHSILSVSSITSKNLEAYKIYRGNPAVEIKIREIEGKI